MYFAEVKFGINTGYYFLQETLKKYNGAELQTLASFLGCLGVGGGLDFRESCQLNLE